MCLRSWGRIYMCWWNRRTGAKPPSTLRSQSSWTILALGERVWIYNLDEIQAARFYGVWGGGEGEGERGGGYRHASPPPTFSRVNIMPLRGCVGASYEHSVNFSGFSPRYSRFGQSVGRPHGDRTCVESSSRPTVQYRRLYNWQRDRMWFDHRSSVQVLEQYRLVIIHIQF
jgi:hypothetical protein